ncbi:MAG: DUF87 domain-containing protein [Saccharofermentans sp.]|nr:DUF87 domain-containing protein [Saccharofermentans sp.]
MGVKKLIAKAGGKAADKVAKLAALSPDQLAEVERQKQEYLSQMPDPEDEAAVELTNRLIAASSVEIFNSYLPQLDSLYVPVQNQYEYGKEFDSNYNIRYVDITKWVTDKDENSLDKLINVYEVLSNEDCNIALIFNRKIQRTHVYMAISNTRNESSNNNANDYIKRLVSAVNGNFPGSELGEIKEGTVPCFRKGYDYSIASASNIPTEKSEKFISQTIEKILDGIIPDDPQEEYTIVLLATPIPDVDERKNRLSKYYSALNPYASWQTNFTYTQSDSTNSMAMFGVNIGASAGVQNTQSNAITDSSSTTDSTGRSITDNTSRSEGTNSSSTISDSTTRGSSQSNTISDSTSRGSTTGSTATTGTASTVGSNEFQSATGGVSFSENVSVGATEGATVGVPGTGVNASVSQNVSVGSTQSLSTTGGSGTSLSDSVSESISEMTSNTVSNTIGRTAGQTISDTVGRTVANTAGRTAANTVGRAVANTLGQAVSTGVATMAGVAKATSFGMNAGANFARSSTVTAQVGKNEGIVQSFVNYNIKHALEKLEQQMKRYETSTALGMWDFATYVISEDMNTANNVAHSYVALTQGEESYMSQAAINLWRGDLGDKSADAREIYSYIKDLRHPLFGLNPDVVNNDGTFLVYPNLVNPTTALSGKELAYSLNFPRKSISGLPVYECAEFGRNIVKYQDDNDDKTLHLGQIFHMNRPESVDVDISQNSLASHTFITGSTGSGKSNTIYTILNRALVNGVKFMVIEPAKGEYKNVFGNTTGVSVYGTNHKQMDLLKINPFSFPSSIHVLEHMDRLVELFIVCWPMYAAMPAVLKDAVEKSYSDCGWDLIDSSNPYGDNLFPCFADVARNVRSIIDSSEYDAENKGAYKGSLLTRLQSLTNGINGMIFSQDEIPPKKLFDENVIVDLSRVGSSETKSLIMGMLVLKLQEYRISEDNDMNAGLKHLTVLEEAHNILKRTSSEQISESGNLLGKSVEMLSNAIAEMRTYGEGFIIADQAPGLLDMSVIRNTNTKIIMRLPDLSDRELVGRAANLNDNQIDELAKLPCGVGAIYQNEWIQPVLCKVDKSSVPSERYSYQYEPQNTPIPDISSRLMIAKMISKGVKISTKKELEEINKTLDAMNADSYIRVATLRILENPPAEPRMTKIAPLMGVLFPEVKDSVEKSFNEASQAKEWTLAAESALKDAGVNELDDIVRRDIIQGVITYYFLNVISKPAYLKEWRSTGGLA